MQHRRRLSFASQRPAPDLFGHPRPAPEGPPPAQGRGSGHSSGCAPRQALSCEGAEAAVRSPLAVSAPAARVPACWVAAHLPDLSLEAFVATLDARARERPVALQNRSGIVAVDPAAAALGVRPGQRRATALALAPKLCLAQADEVRDTQALRVAALAALHFTPSVTLEAPSTVLLEVASTLRLFGGLEALATDLRHRLALLGHRAVLACAPTPLGAVLLARQKTFISDSYKSSTKTTSTQNSTSTSTSTSTSSVFVGTRKTSALPMLVPTLDEGAGMPPPALEMPQPEAFLQQFDRLPVALLTGPQAAQDLQAMGVRTLGGLRALPRAGLARRLGPVLLQMLDRARGDRPDPRAWLVAPETFESGLELQARADNAAQLLQAADVLLARLLAWAGARQGRLPHFELILRHEPRHRADDDRVPAQTVFELALATPSSDAAHLQSLLRERLGRLALPAPALELRIRCARLVHEAPPPQDLFAVRADAQIGFAQLLERLQARLGPDGVRQLRDLDDHRPEQATRAEPAFLSVAASARSTSASKPSAGGSRPPGGQGASKDAQREAGRSMGCGPGTPSAALLTRPAWLLPEPRRLREQTSRPLLDGHPLQLLAGPERLESGWWDGALAVRDYFIAQAGDGALVWVYRSRLASSADETGWFLHGWFG